MIEIKNGVVAPKGFKASGVIASIKKNNKTKKDLGLILSDVKGSAAAIYTTNKVKGAPIFVTQKHISDGYAQAMICNSGNANTCNKNGIEIAEETSKLLAKEANINENDIIIASTGVIGQEMNIEPFKKLMPELVKNLNNDEAASHSAAEAIMTTDTVEKQMAVEFELGGKKVRIGAMTKGSGMIAPNMATMLCFITTDINITSDVLKIALKEAADVSFNMLSVDGDTSTNDMLSIIANGLAENKLIDDIKSNDYKTFIDALKYICISLAKKMAKDGEGASKLLIVKTINASSLEQARIIAKSVCESNLLKAAMFGADANWGRVLCAIGYAKCECDIEKIDMAFISNKGRIDTCKNGFGIEFSEEEAKVVLSEDEITIEINLNSGCFEASSFGCDLTYNYVKINGDYRS